MRVGEKSFWLSRLLSNTQRNNMKKITGDWDGEPIWREETAEDRLAEIIHEVEQERKAKKLSAEIAKIEFKKYDEKEIREDNLINEREDEVCELPDNN